MMKLKKLFALAIATSCLNFALPSYATNISDELINVAEQLEDIKQTNDITLSQAINHLKTLSDSESIPYGEDTAIVEPDEEDTATVQPEHPYIQGAATARVAASKLNFNKKPVKPKPQINIPNSAEKK